MPAQSQPQPKKLLDQVRQALRLKRYSYRTEQTYGDWIKRFILFHRKRHPAEMGADEIEVFLTHLAVNEKVSASTQNQAYSTFIHSAYHPLGGIVRRHHLDGSGLQKAIRRAACLSGIAKPVSSHTFRHCFTTHLLEALYDLSSLRTCIRTVQELLERKDVKTTMIYTHVLSRGLKAVRSPLDI